MPFPTTVAATGSSAQTQIQGVTPFTQSRETVKVSPESANHGRTIAEKNGPRVKPWAHLVAGGYITMGQVTLWNDSY